MLNGVYQAQTDKNFITSLINKEFINRPYL